MCTWGTDKEIILNRSREFTGRVVIAVDACIAEDVQRINDLGIWTLGCCCGHGKYFPHVLIHPSAVPLARSLGFTVTENDSNFDTPYIKL